MTKLLRGFSPVLTMTVLVAVVGLSGTAWANHGKGDGNDNGNGNDNGAATAPTPDTATTSQSSHGDQGDWGDKSDRHGVSHWKPKHHKKASDDDTDYGVATVNVKRGTDLASAWATYSTALGSPVGDTTGGSFRFTCRDAYVTCTVSVGAAVLSDHHGDADFYPRVLIYKQDISGTGPESYCEYGDGTTGAKSISIDAQDLSVKPSYTTVPLDIGGTDDCGLAGPGGGVNQITVGPGYYDVHATFVFVQ